MEIPKKDLIILNLFSHFYPLPSSLTPHVRVDVLLADDEQAGVEGGEDEAVVPRLPEELDVGGVGHAGNGDAVAVLGGRAEGLGHLLFPHTPVGGHEGNAAQEEGRHRLDEGEARGAHLLHQRHHAGTKARGVLGAGRGMAGMETRRVHNDRR